jgi:uncharacterized membrane protein
MMQFLFTQTPLAYFVASFWRDEAFSYLMAHLPLHTLLWSTAQDANPPLYYLLLKLWMGIFGGSEVALRSLSLIFFWATLYVVFLILNDVYKLSTKKSLIYLLIFIANPLLHYYAFEARMYTMMAFFATFLFYMLMKKSYKVYSYVALLALFTHYFLFIVIAFQVGYVYFTAHKTEWGNYIQTLAKKLVWYIPWIVFLIFAHPPVGQSFWVTPPTLKDLFLLPAVVLTGYEQGTWMIVPFLSIISLVVSGVLIVSSYLLWRHKRKSQFYLILGWAIGIPLVVFVISFIKPVFLPRYIIFSAVGISLLLVLSLEAIRNVYLRMGLFILIIGLLIAYSSIQINMRNKASLKQLYTTIRNEMGKNDVLYVTHEYDFHPAEYYLPTKRVYIYKKTYEELPWYVGKVLMDKSAFRSSLPIYPERAFILNNDGTYSIQSSL